MRQRYRLADTPFFSIIIPTYNRADFISRTIDSVLAQAYAHFEVLVVDDGSTDDTSEVIHDIHDSRLRYFKKVNGERGAARNFGVQRATGAYVTFLDSDDRLYENYLMNAAESIARYIQPPFFHLAYEITDEHLRRKAGIDHLKSDDISVFIKGNPLSCMGVFVRRDVAEKHPFREDRQLAGSEDWELWIRLAAHYGIKTDNRISAALIDHDNRSVVGYSREKLVRRKELAMQYAFADVAVQRVFGKYLKPITAHWDSYIALHLMMSRQRLQGLRYLLQSAVAYPTALLERRTLAILKLCMFHSLR